MAALRLSGDSASAFIASHKTKKGITVRLPGLGFAFVFHNRLGAVKKLFGYARLMDALVKLTAKLETSVIKRVLHHPLDLRAGEHSATIILKPFLKHHLSDNRE